MPEARRDITASRIAVLDLKDEQRLAQEGYSLLDEKRILLAAEIQRQVARLVSLRREYTALESDALSRTLSAVGRHGLDELAVYPPQSLALERMNIGRSRLLGLELLTVHFERSVQSTLNHEQPVNPTPEARACTPRAPGIAWPRSGTCGLQREFAPPPAGLHPHRAKGEGD